MTFFFVSLISSLFLLYQVGNVWFAGTRSRYLIIFFLMGTMASIWTLLNGIAGIVSPEAVRILETIWMVFVCCLPFLLFLFVINFVNSQIANIKFITFAILILLIADVAFLLTNPLHMLFYKSFSGNGKGLPGPLFWVHTYTSYMVIAAAFTFIFFYVVKNIRKYPSIILVLIASTCPFCANLLYVFEFYNGFHDFTPLGFVVMFSVFDFFAIQFRQFNLKSAAAANIFDTFKEGFLVINNTGIVEDVNPAFRKFFPLLNIEKQTTTVHDVAGYMHSIAVEYKPDDVFEKMVSLTKELNESECSIYDRDGQLQTLSLSKDFILRRGQSAGYVLTLIDISNYREMISEINQQNRQLIELKDKAEAASKSKSNFLANMSHEIRTPLNAIIGMTTLAGKTSDLKQLDYYRKKTENASLQLLGIINDILDMSKIEANKLELHREDYNFADMVGGIKDIIDSRMKEKNQKLVITISDSVPLSLHGDKLRLSQVMINLLSNAVKFTPEGGEIRLEVDNVYTNIQETKILVSVIDNGIGMNAEQQSRMFSAFEQADGSISRRFGGTGLGLSISKNIIHLMGGEIRVESTEGRGSTFTFDFISELAQSDQPAESAVHYSEDNNYDFSGNTILLAEDIEINSEIITELLKDTGIEIEVATNGQEAFDIYQKSPEKYDLVFMDLQMPLVDGFQATSMIRNLNHPAAKKVPIIAMTANAFAEDISKCLHAGMNDHISKPIDVAVLYERISLHLPGTFTTC